jgi:hypothetical protein
MAMKKKFWIIGAASTVVTGIAGGVFGALLSVSNPAWVSSHTAATSDSVTIKPGTSIILFNQGAARAEVKVDRTGLILLNLTTKTDQKQVALGVLGDSKLALGVFDSTGKAKAGLEVPMKDSGKVHMLLLEKNGTPGSKAPSQS